MSTFKEKLIRSYMKESMFFEYTTQELKAKQTPLRNFIRSIGLDHKDLTRKQMLKWANTKRYKDFKKLAKIKRMADEANVQETVILENFWLFIENFDLDDNDEIISEKEALNFIYILEAIPKIKIYRYHSAKRGPYKSAAEREKARKELQTAAVNRGGIVSGGEGDIIFKGGKKHYHRALGANKLMIRSFAGTSKKTGAPKYRRKTYKVY